MRPDAVNLRILGAESRAWPTWDRVHVHLVHTRHLPRRCQLTTEVGCEQAAETVPAGPAGRLPVRDARYR